MPQDSHLKPRLQRSVALGSIITCPVVSWRRDWRPIRCHCPSAPWPRGYATLKALARLRALEAERSLNTIFSA